MSVDDLDPVGFALRLIVVVLGLAMVTLGVRVAMTRRFPTAWVRGARLTVSQRSQPVRRGGFVALLGAGLLAQQAPFLAPVSVAVGRAMFALALLLVLTAVGWFMVLRR
ncbi:hypothetical protein AB0H57_16725 [Micromonospora sp. NPDC050686]|uniref:hypothetical protein n=1 Tax=Micromonospora sp. NPDC050686 TaxID=3154631 RepID=UPI0033F61073